MHSVMCTLNFVSWSVSFKFQHFTVRDQHCLRSAVVDQQLRRSFKSVSRAKGARRAGLSAKVQKDVSCGVSTEICHQVHFSFILVVCIANF